MYDNIYQFTCYNNYLPDRIRLLFGNHFPVGNLYLTENESYSSRNSMEIQKKGLPH